jgi:hypothetical protein
VRHVEMPTLGHARYTQDSRKTRGFTCAGELSRGVGLRGFESHSPHQLTHTYEKSGSACDSWLVLLRGVQAALVILSNGLCFSSIFIPRSSLGGLNAAVTYPRVEAHSMSRSRSLPIHTPDRYWTRV